LVLQQMETEQDLAHRGFASAVPQAAEEVAAFEAEAPTLAPNDARKKTLPRATFAMPPLVPAKSVPSSGPWPSEPAAATASPQSPTSVLRDFGRPRSSSNFASGAAATPLPAEKALPIEDFVAAAAVPKPTAAAPDREKPGIGSEHDWLEMALAGVEPGSDKAEEPRARTPASESAAVGPSFADEEPAGLAVVGRYEANGSSYALFSDGSIEAMTASGVFRFASMAELKQFIEGGT
jgi:hypothetical protein